MPRMCPRSLRAFLRTPQTCPRIPRNASRIPRECLGICFEPLGPIVSGAALRGAAPLEFLNYFWSFLKLLGTVL
eukprot:9764401-Alexandrium_andersonii.AAC.1